MAADKLLTLCMEKQATHSRILRWYNPEGKPWHQVPDDGYIYANLADHLIGAGRQDELITTLTNSPEWMKVITDTSENLGIHLNNFDQAIGLFSDPLSVSGLLTLIRLHVAKQSIQRKAGTANGSDTVGEPVLIGEAL